MELWQAIGGIAGIILFALVVYILFPKSNREKGDNPFATPGWDATGSVPEDFRAEKKEEETHAVQV